MLRKLLLLAVLTWPAIGSAALLTTTVGGDLYFEFVSSEAASANFEFGLGTPSVLSQPSERQIGLVRTGTIVTPADPVNMGYFAAGSGLDFFMRSNFGGDFWAFSSHLGGSPTPSDLITFEDADNSLHLGTSIVESIGLDNWIFHMDDPASICCDDDDNDFVVRVFVEPTVNPIQTIPEPESLSMMLAGLVVLRLFRSHGGRNIQ